MIIDCYTHVWDSPGQLGSVIKALHRQSSRPSAGRGVGEPNAGTARHLASCEQVDATIVLGFRSDYLNAEIPNDMVAAYVKTSPEKLIGFAGIDPSNPVAAIEEMHRVRDQLGMKGIALSPAAQNLHPCHSKAQAVYDQAVKDGMPVLFHPGIQISRECVLEYAQPILLDEVAREHPTLKIIIAHLGYPWVKETLVLLAKHDNVYSDISWLPRQPWEAYQALLSAYQYGVIDKLLFGSGFPFSSPAASIEALYGINHLCAGTNLPTIPREALRGIVERNALDLLGIQHTTPERSPEPQPGVLDEESELA